MTKQIDLYAGEQYVVNVHAAQVEEPEKPPFIDVIDKMPYNAHPSDPYFVQNGLTTWWERRHDQINGITIHHTLSHDMLAMARYITQSKGRPTTEYTFWVALDGTAYQCVDLRCGCWHDHTGHRNTHISIGMAGRWDYEQPPEAQLRGVVKLCQYLMREYPSIKGVKGHCDYYATACPGWNGGKWRDKFYSLLSGSYSYPVAMVSNNYAAHEDFE